MLASTGPREPTMLTPSVCSNNLLLHEKTVLVQVSRISLRSVPLEMFLSNGLSILFWTESLTRNWSTQTSRNLRFVSWLILDTCTAIIPGFGGKRALGFLLKSELCQKRSKFRMQFCLRVSTNVLRVFSLKFAFFLKYYVCEKTHYSKGILWGPFVEWKTKENFCFAKRWSHYNSFLLLLLLRWRKRVRRWTCQVRICFAETPVRYEVAQFFFPFCSFSSLKNQDIYLKKLCMQLESGEIFYTGYCWWKHTTREFRSSVKAERSDALQLFRIIS